MRIGIRKRLTLLALTGSVLTFLTYALVGIFAVIYIWTISTNHSREISKIATEHTEVFARNAQLLQLELMAKSKAAQISNITREISNDVNFLVNEIELIFDHPQNYKPHKLPTIATAFSLIRQPVVRLNQQLNDSPADLKAVTPEIELLGNLETTFKSLNRVYDSVGVGSKKGYMIASYAYPQYHFIPEVLGFTKPDIYDTLNRPWFKIGIENDGLSFTELYKDVAGDHLALSAVAHYNDRQGVAGVVGVDINGAFFSDLADEELKQKNGNYFVLNAQGKIIFSTLSSGTLSNARQESLLVDPDLQTIVTATEMVSGHNGLKRYSLDGKDYYLAYAPVRNANWSIGVLVDPEGVRKPAREARKMMQGLLSSLDYFMTKAFMLDMLHSVLILPLLLLIIYFLAVRFAKNLSRPIVSLTKSVQMIAKGNFNHQVELKTGDEIEVLADNFNVMTANITKQISELQALTAEKERISTELNVATGIQLSMLPQNFPDKRDRYELYAMSLPAKEVGGDFYDFYFLDQDHLAITIADVSGKGVPAALFMMISKTILKNNTLAMLSASRLAEAVDRANLQLCQDNHEEMFVTAFIGILDLHSGVLNYVSAGHNPPLLGKALGMGYHYLQAAENLPMLGVIEDITYVQQELQLEFGDTLFLYTDGVTEAMDEQGEQFGNDRLAEVLSAKPQIALKQQSEEVLQAVRKHAGAAEQSDDITMLSLRYLGVRQTEDLFVVPKPQEHIIIDQAED